VISCLDFCFAQQERGYHPIRPFIQAGLEFIHAFGQVSFFEKRLGQAEAKQVVVRILF